MMDITVLRRISELIDEENELRSALQKTKPATDEQLRRLRQVEAQLDQCWAQLRQSREHTHTTTSVQGQVGNTNDDLNQNHRAP